MELELNIKMNDDLCLRDPQGSDLGKKIVEHSIILIHRNGFEAFTFKKLAEEIGSTEASIYRYFENKHRLLVYLVAWYWSWLEFQISYKTNNIESPVTRLKLVVELLSTTVEDDEMVRHVNESLLHKIVISEGSKVYLTKHVMEDNQHKFFKPYKDLCAVIGSIIVECQPTYPYPKSLASTIIEMAHFQNFFMLHLPSLTDFSGSKDDALVSTFLTDLVFASLGKEEERVVLGRD